MPTIMPVTNILPHLSHSLSLPLNLSPSLSYFMHLFVCVYACGRVVATYANQQTQHFYMFT